MSTAITVAIAKEVITAVIQAEPEAPGPIPPKIMAQFQSMPIEEVFRAGIRGAKMGLLHRLLGALSQWEEEVPKTIEGGPAIAVPNTEPQPDLAQG